VTANSFFSFRSSSSKGGRNILRNGKKIQASGKHVKLRKVNQTVVSENSTVAKKFQLEYRNLFRSLHPLQKKNGRK
jgi:hypothetical protein